jgi:hypothetical protein
MAMKFFNGPAEAPGHKASSSINIHAMALRELRNINMHAIKTFLDTGDEHGTTVEALYEASRQHSLVKHRQLAKPSR